MNVLLHSSIMLVLINMTAVCCLLYLLPGRGSREQNRGIKPLLSCLCILRQNSRYVLRNHAQTCSRIFLILDLVDLWMRILLDCKLLISPIRNTVVNIRWIDARYYGWRIVIEHPTLTHHHHVKRKILLELFSSRIN